jgi:hypothetical protein
MGHYQMLTQAHIVVVDPLKGWVLLAPADAIEQRVSQWQIQHIPIFHDSPPGLPLLVGLIHIVHYLLDVATQRYSAQAYPPADSCILIIQILLSIFKTRASCASLVISSFVGKTEEDSS